VRDGYRGIGTGAALLAVVRRFAHDQRCIELQWQTPDWNQDAARFYRREGAFELSKTRFVLQVCEALLSNNGSASTVEAFTLNRGDD
jgi:hypothetical protein